MRLRRRLFSLLIEDFGAKGVQVEEIYDLQEPFEPPVYGFIFLFKWMEQRRARRNIIIEEDSYVMDEEIVNKMFFAKQTIPDSCATHALLSVLLNCEKLRLGDMLTRLRDFTAGMSPEDKGVAIGNIPEIARAHNSHARPDPFRLADKQQCVTGVRMAEAFHFVSYVPIHGRLFELDGLRKYPIDHGPWGEHEDWTEKFRRVINERLGVDKDQDIRYNLMAVVPEKKYQYEQQLTTLRMNRQIVLEALQRMVKVAGNEADLAMTSPLRRPIGKVEPMVTRSKRKGGRHVAGGPRDVTEDVDEPDEDDAALPRDVTEDQFAGMCSSKLSSVVTKLEKRFEEGGVTSETLQPIRERGSVKIEIKTLCGENGGAVTMPITVATTDVCKPLIINTKFSTSPGGDSESTDTASEVGSLLNSPVFSTSSQSQSSPTVHRWTHPEHAQEDRKRRLETLVEEGDLLAVKDVGADGKEAAKTPSPKHQKHRQSSHQGFTPKDLLALLKNVENEITVTELAWREEMEKRRRYKIDDCRRTHNYDQFICTFLSMLAEQGLLTPLVEQQMVIPAKKPAPKKVSAKVTAAKVTAAKVTAAKTANKTKVPASAKKQKPKLTKKKKS